MGPAGQGREYSQGRRTVKQFDGIPALFRPYLHIRPRLGCGPKALRLGSGPLSGGVPERSIGAVSKTVVPFGYRGFESHPLRHLPFLESPALSECRRRYGGGSSVFLLRSA